MTPAPNRIARYRVVGMDCVDCATEIEHAVRGLVSVADARVSLASGLLTVRLGSGAPHPQIERTVQELGCGATALSDSTGSSAGQSHLAPGYRRALHMPAIGISDFTLDAHMIPHALAINTWMGPSAPPPPADVAGLRHLHVIAPAGR